MTTELTKENFWNEMSEKYPKAMAHFLAWVDEYKKNNNWHMLFNYTVGANELLSGRVSTKADIAKEKSPKYHELPVALQFGVFLEFAFDFKYLIGTKNFPYRTTIDFSIDFVTLVRLRIEKALSRLEGKA